MSEQSMRAEESTADQKTPQPEEGVKDLLPGYYTYVPRRQSQFHELSFILGVVYALLLVAIFKR